MFVIDLWKVDCSLSAQEEAKAATLESYIHQADVVLRKSVSAVMQTAPHTGMCMYRVCALTHTHIHTHTDTDTQTHHAHTHTHTHTTHTHTHTHTQHTHTHNCTGCSAEQLSLSIIVCTYVMAYPSELSMQLRVCVCMCACVHLYALYHHLSMPSCYRESRQCMYVCLPAVHNSTLCDETVHTENHTMNRTHNSRACSKQWIDVCHVQV